MDREAWAVPPRVLVIPYLQHYANEWSAAREFRYGLNFTNLEPFADEKLMKK